MGCCLFASMLAGAPRLAFLIFWLIRPLQVQTAFSSFLVAILGVIFLPWTTLYVFVAPGGLIWFDWIVLGIGIMIDIGTYTSGVYSNNKRTA